ncbi:MAG: hypothetical protein IH596_13900 [Bacteroidales bacterium]|nr:hypothetical protein [Bacteroidales bacterium]
MKRRQFIYNTVAATAGAVILPNLWGCNKEDNSITPLPASSPFYKYLEASGTHYEVGKQIGSYYKSEINAAQLGVKDLLVTINGIVQSAPDVFYQPFLNAAENVFPDYVDELKGMADGSGISFQQLFTTNLMMEIIYLYYELSGKKTPIIPGNLGCSTVAYAKNGKLFLGHNEDLFTCFINSMYVVKISIPGKPQFVGLNYPGILPGMPPCMNEAGIVQTGNDICGQHIEPSVPMVFHFRSAMDASSLSDAISRVTIPERARTMTHNLGSFLENKIVCVEAAPSKHEQHEVDNFFVHTNHFILPEMTDIQLDEGTLPSSISRFDVLTAEAGPYSDNPSAVSGGLLTGFLSSHEGEYSPCVHDHGGASTLGHAVFDFQNKNLKMNYSNPCLGISKIYNI